MKKSTLLLFLVIAIILVAFSAETALADDLFELVWEGDVEGVREAILEEGVDVNISDDGGWTPLMYAARDGKEDIAWDLMWHGGANLNLVNNSSQTALDIAEEQDNEEIAEMIEDLGGINAFNYEIKNVHEDYVHIFEEYISLIKEEFANNFKEGEVSQEYLPFSIEFDAEREEINTILFGDFSDFYDDREEHLIIEVGNFTAHVGYVGGIFNNHIEFDLRAEGVDFNAGFISNHLVLMEDSENYLVIPAFMTSRDSPPLRFRETLHLYLDGNRYFIESDYLEEDWQVHNYNLLYDPGGGLTGPEIDYEELLIEFFEKSSSEEGGEEEISVDEAADMLLSHPIVEEKIEDLKEEGANIQLTHEGEEDEYYQFWLYEAGNGTATIDRYLLNKKTGEIYVLDIVSGEYQKLEDE